MVARINEAKVLGVKLAGPWHKIEKRFPKGTIEVFSSNYALDGDMSQRVTGQIL